MKNIYSAAKRPLWLLIGCLISVITATAQISPPTLVSQPTDQTADYGANVEFGVSAAGGPLSYQWRKDGEELQDYRNVAGAQTATLRLIGVAHNDAAGYSVVVRNAIGAVTSVVATLTVRSAVVFRDNFESGNLTNWVPFASTNGLHLSDLQNHTPGGSISALLSGSGDKMYHNLGVELAGRVGASFWIYDTTNGQSRAFGELRGYTGPGHTRYAPRGGLHQLFAIGRYDAEFERNTGALIGEATNSMKYQGRVLRGTNSGWFNLDAPGTPDRSEGWHQFEIRRAADGHTVAFYVDGVLGKVVTGAAHHFLDCVAIGSAGVGSSTGDTWFDDVRVEAYPRRFDWQSKDSSGKGLFDWMKVRETGTNASVAENLQVNTVLELPGYPTSGMLGNWERDGGAIHALDMRGYVDYVVTAPADDAYRIEVEGREQNFKKPAAELPLIISIDGEPLGRFNLSYGDQTNGLVRCFTPFLRAGPHTVRIFWDNAAPRCSLRVEAVRLQVLHGADLNGNGFKDWVENRVYAQNGMDIAPAASLVSPVCVEGRGQYLSMMVLAAGIQEPLSPVQIQRGPGHRWYANVPLSVEAGTVIEAAYQNGALTEMRQIVWEETNLLEADNLVIRKGDSLLLTAAPTNAIAGTIRIAVVGVTNYTTVPIAPIVHRFDETGTFAVRGTFVPTEATRSITVKVVGASLDDPVVAWVNKRRYWDCTNLPPMVALDADPRLKMARFPAPAELGVNARQMSVINDEAEPRMVAARLGREGPILASATVEGFRLLSGVDTYLRHLGSYNDGSQMIEAALVLSPVLPQVVVELRVLVSGVTFDDGTVTRTLTAADFDTLGICRVRFIRAAGVTTSVCHATKVYQNGVLIGWPGNPK